MVDDKKDKSVSVSLRISPALAVRLDVMAAEIMGLNPGLRVSRVDVLRMLAEKHAPVASEGVTVPPAVRPRKPNRRRTA